MGVVPQYRSRMTLTSRSWSNWKVEWIQAEIDELEARGHTVEVNQGRAFGGSAKLIVIDPATGVRTAGSDPRTDGHAVAVCVM